MLRYRTALRTQEAAIISSSGPTVLSVDYRNLLSISTHEVILRFLVGLLVAHELINIHELLILSYK